MFRILLVLAAALPLFATPLPPAPTRWVTDAAGVIPDDREAALNAKLEQHERETSNQLLVYIDHKVPAGTTIEQMGVEAIRAWKVGQAKKDNGAILFLFIDDRTSRIEVGYGFEGVLTDALSKRILVDLRPALLSGDYASAIELGASSILDVLVPPSAPVAAYDTAAAIDERAAQIAAREAKLFIPTVLFSIVFIAFLIYMLYRVYIVGDWKFGGSGDSRSGGSSSSSTSSSSSGFSGGGGRSGGGGASDSW